MKNLKLCEICDVRDGTHDSPSYYSEGYPFITTKNLVNGSIDFSTASLICEKDYQHFDKRSHVDDGDILMPMIGTIGGAVRVKKDRDFAIKNVALIKKKNENIDFDFLLNVLNSNRMKSFFEQYKTGGTQKFISLTFIRNLPIPDISLEEQKEIATNLKKIQSAIDNKKQQLSLLDEAVKSEFVEMFGNPIDNDKSFPKKRMTDVCPIQEAKLQIVSDSVWLLNLDMIEQDTGTILDKQFVSMDEVGNSTIQFSSDHVLYSKLRPYLNKVALPDEAGYASSELVPFLPKREMNKIYFAYLLRSDSFVELINSKSGGAKMPRASMDFIRKFEIPVPPLSLQKQFAAFVQQIDKSKFVVKQQIADLQELLDSKMQEYFG
ncbi:restriction endonuclease subunit S [Treponema bryantii]|uniref:restriction endonuclease subunit S n=1 Tax=Treponema bryantii TaxID=163 RepID=UPI0003B32308|nr:restriction endonuclease subunit S [Treponema bryantii]